MSTVFTNFFNKINQIPPQEHNFTEVLSTIVLTPKTLYFRGKIPENMVKITKNKTEQTRTGRPKTVAIVGSRHNTRYGEEVAYKLAYELAQHGVVVISGLAYGIDSIAHKGCLAAGGITVAVLGNPINKIHPTAHESIARQIVMQGGALISEYPPYTEEYQNAPLAPGEFYNKAGHRSIDFKTSFLYRNRLISALSDVVVVVEAAEQSGSLNTATHAIEQGKTVFAVPGNITNPYSQGCNKLIRQGALPYTSPQDVLRELFPDEYIKKRRRLKHQNLIGDTDVESQILQAIADGARSGEEIMAHASLPPEIFNQTVTILEIKGRLRSLGANNWGLS